MTDPFASALDAIFSAPGSEAAEHVSVFGIITKDIRVICGRADQTMRLGDQSVITSSIIVEIRMSQVPQVADGDTLYVGVIEPGTGFVPQREMRLTGEPMSDSEGLCWTIGAEIVDVSR